MANKRKGQRRLKRTLKVLTKHRVETEKAIEKAKLQREWLVFWNKFKKAQLRDRL